MRSRLVTCTLSLVVALFSTSAFSQSSPATGSPPLSSSAGGTFDSVDLANLNVHFSIPVFSRAGKTFPFSYALSYDSLVWQMIIDGTGHYRWWPASNYGWRGITEPATGYVSYNYSSTNCGPGGSGEAQTWSNWVYHDPSGTPHKFPGIVKIYDLQVCGHNQTFSTATASENSGYVLYLPDMTQQGSLVQTTVMSPSGVNISPPSQSPNGSASLTDPNGNSLVVNAMVNTTVTDTLGTAVTIVGTAPNPVQYQYTAPNGNTVSATMTYRTYTITTQFGVSGINEYSLGGVGLVDRVTLPDGTYYQFYYETTGTGQPYTGGGAGPVTGRIAEVVLRSGGSITYTYGSSNSMMLDGSPSYMVRSLGGGAWTYTRAIQSGQQIPQTTATVIDPYGNYTDLNFSGVYETSRAVYAGARTTILDYSYNCYNSNTTDSTCPAASVVSPITAKYHADHLSQVTTDTGQRFSGVTSSFDNYGNLTNETDYDYGTGAVTGHPVLRVWGSNYVSSLCTTYNICDRPYQVGVWNAANQAVSYTYHTYDQQGLTHGSLTQLDRMVQGPSNYLHQYYSYNSNGTLATATDVNGTVTTYSYAGSSCGGAFPTSVTVGGLATQYSYNCTGGVATSVTDPNGAVTSTVYTDPYFWRPASSTDALGNVTSYSYISPTQSEAAMNFGSSTQDELITLDGLGRTILDQKRQAPGSGICDTIYTVYDYVGRVAWLTLPYTDTCWQQPQVGKPATNYNYDALNRYTLVQDWTGVRAQYQYNANDALVTLPAPTGESPKKKQFEYDALGRLASVCELTSLGGSGTCSQNSPQTGYWTVYQYDPLGDLTQAITAYQIGPGYYQPRTFTYDGLGRLTSETNPETTNNHPNGTVTYTYDSDGTCGSSNGDKVKRVDAASNVTCYHYDGLHRVTQINYSGGQNTANMPTKLFAYDSSLPYGWGIGASNPLGRMTGAATVLGSSTLTADVFSYDARGQVTDYYQFGGNWYHVQQSYNAVEQRVGLQGFLNTGGTTNPFTHSFGYDVNEGEGRQQGLWDGTTSSAAWCCTMYNAAGQPDKVYMVGAASGTAEVFTYDAASNRMTQWLSSNSSVGKSQTGSLTWNVNGTLSQLQISDTYNPANNQTCTYNYDAMGRIGTDDWNNFGGVKCTNGSQTVLQQQIEYDGYNNLRLKSGTLSFTPSYDYTNRNNHILSVGSKTITYDGMGNMTADSFGNTFTYDAEARPVTAGGAQVAYDALGRAAYWTANGITTQVLYDGDGRKFAFMNGQSLINYFVPLTAGVQAVYDQTGLKYYRHADWLGSSWLQLNTDGTLHGDRAYAPYGEPYDETTTADRSFTGQTSDTVTDPNQNGTSALYDFLYRQYSPTQGRWLAPDPAGLAAVDITNPQTWNRYAYVANNPLSNVDPLGLDCVYVTDTGRTSVIVGDCQSSTDDGYYVNGKVTNVTYDANTDHLSIAYNGNPGFVTFANAGFDDSSGSVGSGFFIGGGTVSANHGSVAQCLGEAAIDFGLDLTSLSMLPDANQDNWQWSSDKMGFIFAGTTASAGGFSTAVGVSEKASDWVKNTPAAQAEIRQFFRSQDVKISMKHVAKDAAFVGKWAGRAGAVLSVKAGYDRYQKCRGY